ncbi:monocarboxylate transporter 13 [Patella vulgata]|uniref:monocarboxylate transporter 13 n=1 Tax=Patella vulgata TaxID=6465 RepID=UPI00217F5695|nr:monocarboxylate transporter 13 [Patella vulgata]
MATIEPWAWVVLFAAFMNMFLNGSLSYSVGVIHIALLETYPEENVNTIAWLGSLFSCAFALLGFIGSTVINIFNVRTCVILSGLMSLAGFGLSSLVTDVKHLFITFGLIAGCGQAMALTGSMVVAGYYFKERTGMATGIVTSSAGVSLFVFPPLTQYLIDTYTLQETFLLLGAIGFHSVICGALMRPTQFEIKSKFCPNCKDSNGTSTEKIKVSSKLGSLLSLPYMFLLVSSVAFGVGLSTVYLFLPHFFKQSGSATQEIAFSLSFMGFGGFISRILLGFLTNTTDATLLYGSTFGIIGMITLFLNKVTSVGSKIAYSIIFGLYTGGCWTLQHAILVEIVGLSKLSTGYGINMLMSGIGYLIGPPLLELMALNFNDEYLVFVCAALVLLLASSMGFAIRLVKKSVVLHSSTDEQVVVGDKDIKQELIENTNLRQFEIVIDDLDTCESEQFISSTEAEHCNIQSDKTQIR